MTKILFSCPEKFYCNLLDNHILPLADGCANFILLCLCLPESLFADKVVHWV